MTTRRLATPHSSHAACLALLLLAHSSPAQTSPAHPLRLEPGPIMPPGIPATRTSPAYRSPLDGPGFLAQVNTNAQGLNIIGDAANEPSLAVDPRAPLRMAVGWRHFDTITSSFRQAGYAFTRDGGRTWTTGTLTPGTFRTDPVLRFDAEGRLYYSTLRVEGGVYTVEKFISADAGQSWSAPIFAFGGDKQWIAIDRTTGPGRGNVYHWWNTAGNNYFPNQFNRSIDRGLTWSSPVTIPSQPVFGTGAVGPDGTLWIAGVTNGNFASFWLTRSSDAQFGSAAPVLTTTSIAMGGSLIFNFPPNPAGLGGQVNVAVDTSTGPRRGWIYVLASVDPAGPADPADVVLIRSTDNGLTWSAPIRVNNDAPGPNAYQWFGTLGISPNGRLDVLWNDTRESQLPTRSRVYYASSSDGGVTWQGNTPVTPEYDSTIGWPQQNKIGDYWDIESDLVGASAIISTTFTGGQDVYYLRLGDQDCNSNGIPDALELSPATDCNGNGLLDTCEIAAGTPVPCACEANCDGSVAPPILNAGDLACFLARFRAALSLPSAAAQIPSYANCDRSTTPPVLNAGDFACFLLKFRAGCN